MIGGLNRLEDLVEEDLTEDLDVVRLAAALGTTEYHLRRMFSSLAGMPLSEYVRRRRMTVAAAEVVTGIGDPLCLRVTNDAETVWGTITVSSISTSPDAIRNFSRSRAANPRSPSSASSAHTSGS